VRLLGSSLFNLLFSFRIFENFWQHCLRENSTFDQLLQLAVGVLFSVVCHGQIFCFCLIEQESPAVADKPTRRESMPKNAQIRCAYNVVADNTGLYSYV